MSSITGCCCGGTIVPIQSIIICVEKAAAGRYVVLYINITTRSKVEISHLLALIVNTVLKKMSVQEGTTTTY